LAGEIVRQATGNPAVASLALQVWRERNLVEKNFSRIVNAFSIRK